MAIAIPTLAEARAVLQALYPTTPISDGAAELSRYRQAIGLNPWPSDNIALEKMIKKLIVHEDRLDLHENLLQNHEARLDALENP